LSAEENSGADAIASNELAAKLFVERLIPYPIPGKVHEQNFPHITSCHTLPPYFRQPILQSRSQAPNPKQTQMSKLLLLVIGVFGFIWHLSFVI
jgi:hypothetical protein